MNFFKNYIFNCILFLFACQGISAQSHELPISLSESEEFEVPKDYYHFGLKSIHENQFLHIFIKGETEFLIRHYDKDMKFQHEKYINVDTFFNKGVESFSMITMKDKVYLIMRDVYTERKTEGLSVLEYLPDQMAFVPKSIKLFESNDKVQFNQHTPRKFFFDNFQASYSLWTSENENYFMVTYKTLPKQKNDKLNNEIRGIFVFDINMNLIWGDEVTMPYTEAKMDYEDFLISNDGKVYLLCKVYTGDIPKEGFDKNHPNYSIELLTVDKGKIETEKIKVTLNDFFTKTSNLYQTSQDEILLWGYYSQTFGSNIEGAYIYSLNKDQHAFIPKKGSPYKIPYDEIIKYSTPKEIKKIDAGVKNLEQNQIFVDDNGTITLIAEQSELSSQMRLYDKYISYIASKDDLYVHSIKNDGTFWVKKIPKKQTQESYTMSDNLLSYSSILKKGNLYLFFFDREENLSLTEKEAPTLLKDGQKGFIIGVKLDTNGVATKYKLADLKTLVFRPDISKYKLDKQNNLRSKIWKSKKNISIHTISVQ